MNGSNLWSLSYLDLFYFPLASNSSFFSKINLLWISLDWKAAVVLCHKLILLQQLTRVKVISRFSSPWCQMFQHMWEWCLYSEPFVALLSSIKSGYLRCLVNNCLRFLFLFLLRRVSTFLTQLISGDNWSTGNWRMKNWLTMLLKNQC